MSFIVPVRLSPLLRPWAQTAHSRQSTAAGWHHNHPLLRYPTVSDFLNFITPDSDRSSELVALTLKPNSPMPQQLTDQFLAGLPEDTRDKVQTYREAILPFETDARAIWTYELSKHSALLEYGPDKVFLINQAAEGGKARILQHLSPNPRGS